MTILIITLCLILAAVLLVQLGKLNELSRKLKGDAESEEESNSWNASLGMVFMPLFLIACTASAFYYKNSMLGYGPHEAASEHGGALDSLFNITLACTGIVFIITQILLFLFAYRYQGRRDRKASFVSHNNTLELVWSIIPAIVMTLLVVAGLDAWNEVMADVDEGEEYTEIEVTGSQFLWYLRYPGPDGKLGTKNFRKITPTNPLGQDWTDTKNLDDFQPDEIVLPVNKQVRVRITARDVLHNFDLPHFRVKMDAIPGLPTYFVFTPNTTTEEYRERLGALDADDNPIYPEWHELYDPEDPESGPRYKSFDYELACAELCGKGHFSMRKKVRIVTEAEYEAWLAKQKSYYLRDIRNSDEDPFKGKLLDVEIKGRSEDFKKKLSEAVKSDKPEDRILRLEYVTFMTGSADLTKLSRYQLKDLANAMKENPEMTIELAGHTDSAGDDGSNLLLSQARAEAVFNYLTTNENIDGSRMKAEGYGETRPIDTNDTAEGRKKNRRTEFQILTY